MAFVAGGRPVVEQFKGILGIVGGALSRSVITQNVRFHLVHEGRTGILIGVFIIVPGGRRRSVRVVINLKTHLVIARHHHHFDALAREQRAGLTGGDRFCRSVMVDDHSTVATDEAPIFHLFFDRRRHGFQRIVDRTRPLGVERTAGFAFGHGIAAEKNVAGFRVQRIDIFKMLAKLSYVRRAGPLLGANLSLKSWIFPGDFSPIAAEEGERELHVVAGHRGVDLLADGTLGAHRGRESDQRWVHDTSAKIHIVLVERRLGVAGHHVSGGVEIFEQNGFDILTHLNRDRSRSLQGDVEGRLSLHVFTADPELGCSIRHLGGNANGVGPSDDISGWRNVGGRRVGVSTASQSERQQH